MLLLHSVDDSAVCRTRPTKTLIHLEELRKVELDAIVHLVNPIYAAEDARRGLAGV
jgi:hypothetical protein